MSHMQVVPDHLGFCRFALVKLVDDVIKQQYENTKMQTQYMLDEEKVPKTQNHCKCADAWLPS